MTTLTQHLEQLGLDRAEIRFLVELLKAKSLSPSELAKRTGIHRATIYPIAKKLLAKGLIFEDRLARGVRFCLGKPEDLLGLIQKEKEQLEDKKQLVLKTIDLLKDHTSLTSIAPQYRKIESREIHAFLRRHATIWDKSAEHVDGVWWGYQDAAFIANHLDWLTWLWKSVHLKTRVCVFSNATSIEKKLERTYRRREIRTLKNSTFNATTWVVGHFIIHIVKSGEEEYLLELEHPILAQNHRAIFRELWERTS